MYNLITMFFHEHEKLLAKKILALFLLFFLLLSTMQLLPGENQLAVGVSKERGMSRYIQQDNWISLYNDSIEFGDSMDLKEIKGRLTSQYLEFLIIFQDDFNSNNFYGTLNLYLSTDDDPWTGSTETISFGNDIKIHVEGSGWSFNVVVYQWNSTSESFDVEISNAVNKMEVYSNATLFFQLISDKIGNPQFIDGTIETQFVLQGNFPSSDNVTISKSNTFDEPASIDGEVDDWDPSTPKLQHVVNTSNVFYTISEPREIKVLNTGTNFYVFVDYTSLDMYKSLVSDKDYYSGFLASISTTIYFDSDDNPSTGNDSIGWEHALEIVIDGDGKRLNTYLTLWDNAQNILWYWASEQSETAQNTTWCATRDGVEIKLPSGTYSLFGNTFTAYNLNWGITIRDNLGTYPSTGYTKIFRADPNNVFNNTILSHVTVDGIENHSTYDSSFNVTVYLTPLCWGNNVSYSLGNDTSNNTYQATFNETTLKWLVLVDPLLAGGYGEKIVAINIITPWGQMTLKWYITLESREFFLWSLDPVWIALIIVGIIIIVAAIAFGAYYFTRSREKNRS